MSGRQTRQQSGRQKGRQTGKQTGRQTETIIDKESDIQARSKEGRRINIIVMESDIQAGS